MHSGPPRLHGPFLFRPFLSSPLSPFPLFSPVCFRRALLSPSAAVYGYPRVPVAAIFGRKQKASGIIAMPLAFDIKHS